MSQVLRVSIGSLHQLLGLVKRANKPIQSFWWYVMRDIADQVLDVNEFYNILIGLDTDHAYSMFPQWKYHNAQGTPAEVERLRQEAWDYIYRDISAALEILVPDNPDFVTAVIEKYEQYFKGVI